MEFKGRRVRRRLEIQIEVNYPSGVQFYSDPPTGDILLTEFDDIASDRLKILRAVEHLNLLGYVKDSDEWINNLYEEFSKNKYFINAADKDSKERVDEIQKARRQDHVSHFILRLVFCRSEDLRRWFVDRETDLFRARLLYASRSGLDLKAFLVANNLKYLIVAEEEQQRKRENLIAGSFHVGEDNIDGMTFYKVPFTDALELVRRKKVFLKAGLAYVPEGDVATLVINSFRTRLSRAVANAYKALPEVESDERLVCLLKDFDKRYIAKDYLSRKPVNIHITPDVIDSLANKSFPPCMRQLNDVLRSTYHLKHHGRLIYGLFLKAAGLSMEDSLTFWRSHFLKIMDEDMFRKKKYAYGIRYIYGKEGMRKDCLPYGCMKIIGHSPGPSETHGCPFRHTDAPLLWQRLAAYGVSQQVIHEIMVLVSKQHYQAACQCFWEALHGVPIEGGIDHPNQFFEESYMLLNGGAQPSQVEYTSGGTSNHPPYDAKSEGPSGRDSIQERSSRR
ncbi:DNA primase large subunit-like [Eriocheir sinensis]|uniref:DNA primase large subunit-like n=1 Tax=Eriocheir sinensis TaxID=95602 RepID=UPI0021CA7E64|nr:DNA primase large subunit-like [Eriocheir sinensis]